MTPALQVDGVDVFIDGAGPRTVVMIHGWPDTWRLWDSTVAGLSGHLRCVRFTLPGFDVAKPKRVLSLDAMVDFIARVVDEVCPGRPVVLLVHDWGCVFGYAYLMRHPQRVERLIGVDVGDAGSKDHAADLRVRDKVGIFAYQVWLAAAWVIGGRLGDRMTRAMARRARCPADAALIGAQMNYPYFIHWTGRHGGYRGRVQIDPPCPMLYLYGTRKPFMFHSLAWADSLALRPGCRVLPMKTGHWVMCQAPDVFNRETLDWLAAAQHAVTAAGPAAGEGMP